ncbi:hypothetical protein TSUD_86870 [Trifolium subterraneum]|uniref:Uncharacterized protein n=1 Tax=Trifolium subterraneum TaxID=3900 RepID=A0A2Z6NN27_TRISU|nr:hypothetical protein TSUD_86870 [Trifolium subterraneum]
MGRSYFHLLRKFQTEIPERASGISPQAQVASPQGRKFQIQPLLCSSVFRPMHKSAQCSSPLRVFKFAFFLCPLGLVFGFTISTHLNGVGSHVFWMVVMEFMWCGGRSHYCRSFSFFDPHLLPYHFDPVWCCCRSETRGSDLTFGCLSVLLFFRREWWVGVDPEVWCGFGVAVGSFIWSGSGCRRF